MERAHTQFTVSVKSEVGQLRKLAMALAREGVVAPALSWQAEGEAGFIRFITDRTFGVAKALERLGWPAVQTSVLSVPVSNRPGELARMLNLLEDAEVAISEMYGSSERGDVCRLVLAVDKPKLAEKLLTSFAENLVLQGR